MKRETTVYVSLHDIWAQTKIHSISLIDTSSKQIAWRPPVIYQILLASAGLSSVHSLLMADLCNRGHYIFVLWFLSIFFYLSFFSSPNLSGHGLPYFYTWCGPSANLEYRSEMCCTRLATNAGPKKVAKNRHLGTIPPLCRAIFATKACIGNRKKLVKQQYLPYMFPQYGELRPTSGWDGFVSLGHPR